MKKTFLIFVCVLLSIFCFSSVSYSQGGIWWKTLNRSEKVIYLKGFSDGNHLGHQWSWWKVKDPKCGEMVWDSYQEYLSHSISLSDSLEIVKKLDVLYSYYENRNIDLEWGIWVVLSEMDENLTDEQRSELIKNVKKLGDKSHRLFENGNKKLK